MWHRDPLILHVARIFHANSGSADQDLDERIERGLGGGLPYGQVRPRLDGLAHIFKGGSSGCLGLPPAASRV